MNEFLLIAGSLYLLFLFSLLSYRRGHHNGSSKGRSDGYLQGVTETREVMAWRGKKVDRRSVQGTLL